MPEENSSPTISAKTKQAKGLRRALFTALIVSLVAPGIIAGSLLIYLNHQRTLESETRTRVEKLGTLLQGGMTIPLWDVSPESGRPLIDAISTDPSVAAITVQDNRGKLLLEFDRREKNSSAGMITVSRPITYSGTDLGTVTLHYATTMATNQAKRAATQLFAIIGIQLLVSTALFGTWLSRRVLNPLETLRHSADRIASGDLQTDVPALGADEFGELSHQLDTMRESLAQSVTQLEDRVERRTHELREVNFRLQKTLADLQRMQNCLVQSEKLASLGSLVAGVAHELNTPIGTSITLVSTVADRCAELGKLIVSGIQRSHLESSLNEIRQASQLAHTNLERASSLVQDFKQVAVDQTSSRRRKFLLDELFREMMVAVRLRHKHASVTINVTIPEGVMMDSYPGTLEQIISNLVENAVLHGTHGRAQCTVEIVARALENVIILTVSDDGIGIQPDHLARIFDPFFTTSMGKGGSGLGLSIVYSLTTGMLGGTVSVHSQPGQGTEFQFELPYVAPEHPATDYEMGTSA